MNILFINGTYPCYGGTEKVTTILANQFVSEGFHVHIASFKQVNEELLTELDEKVMLHKLYLPVFSRKNISIIRKILLESDIDIIINQWCLPYLTTMLLNKARKGFSCKLISVLHGVPDKSKKVIVMTDKLEHAKSKYLRILYRVGLNILNKIIRKSICLTYANSDRYVVLSHGFINTFKNYTKLINLSKLLSIGNPLTIKTDFLTDCIPSKRKQLLYVGRMDYENKRVNRIIEVWEKLSFDFPEWNLVLVGDGPHRRQLEEYVCTFKIPRVTFTGFIREEPVKYYQQSSIFILTSDLEGFGLVITEAMSYGVVPVVYGSYISVYDIIDNGVNGYITKPPYSSLEMEQKLRSLMNDGQLRTEMAYQAIEKSKKYSIEAVIGKWKILLNDVIYEESSNNSGNYPYEG